MTVINIMLFKNGLHCNDLMSEKLFQKQELVRTKGMILNRFIPVQEAPEEIREFALFKLLIYCDTLMEKKRKKVS